MNPSNDLNLGRPVDSPSQQQQQQGSALNASGNPGDYNTSSADQGFAKEVLDSLNSRSSAGQQEHSSVGQYATTNPGSGTQGVNESEPHAGHLHSGSHAHAHFPNESDTLTSGEAGKFGSENDARRQDGLVESASGQPSLTGHTTGTGYGLNKGHLGSDSLSSSAAGQTDRENTGVAHNSILNTGEQPKELKIGGFNPKTNNDASIPEPSATEKISTDGPHGLVFQESTGKYVHRRELEGEQ